ncbi:galactose oxidase [Lophiostoma macrostomum CBS 122681]|uniref:Galactose oxidase n=1 Tax=Lophiostoma macrostomum CBS 122681 TaxID=1314788 RepID=A0A6A6TDT9_9PLEO|nr:galactose oxidase [Lophiostoma macrostomum CBS 122681]
MQRQSPWVSLAKLLSPRQEHGTVAMGHSSIFIIGGITPTYGNDTSNQIGYSTTDLVEMYDIASNTWTARASAPFKVNHPNVATVGRKIYLLGGLVEANDPPSSNVNWTATRESYVYDADTDTWKALVPMPNGTGRGSAIMGVQGEMIYLAGGMTFLDYANQNSVSSVLAFNTTSESWQTLPDAASILPEGRQHGVGAVVGSTFYVLGGRYMQRAYVRGTVFMLDLRCLEEGWKTCHNRMPVPRGGLCGGAVGPRFYTFGGEANPNATNGIFRETEMFDMATETWADGAPMAVPRHGLSAVAVGNRVYLPGGDLQEDGIPVLINGTEHFMQTSDHFDAYVV